MRIIGQASVALLVSVLVVACQPSENQAERSERTPSVPDTPQIVGSWTGLLNAGGTNLEVIFIISQAPDGTIKASIDSVSQGVYDIPVEAASFESGHLILEAKSVLGVLDVNLEGGNTLRGRWNQAGQSYPLELTRAN